MWSVAIAAQIIMDKAGPDHSSSNHHGQGSTDHSSSNHHGQGSTDHSSSSNHHGQGSTDHSRLESSWTRQYLIIAAQIIVVITIPRAITMEHLHQQVMVEHLHQQTNCIWHIYNNSLQ